MGKLLQVRVMAFTVDPGKVEDAWPELCKLAYPPGNDYAPAARGVLELISTLHARLTAGELPPKAAARVKTGLDPALALTAQLEEALAAWRPDQARALTDRIEDALDALEEKAVYG